MTVIIIFKIIDEIEIKNTNNIFNNKFLYESMSIRQTSNK